MVCAMLRCSTLRICRLVGALELHSQCHQCVTCLLILGEESFFFLLCTIAMQHHFVLGSYSSYTLFFPNIYTCIHIIILSLQCGWVEKCFGWVVYRWLHPTYFMKWRLETWDCHPIHHLGCRLDHHFPCSWEWLRLTKVNHWFGSSCVKQPGPCCFFDSQPSSSSW